MPFLVCFIVLLLWGLWVGLVQLAPAVRVSIPWLILLAHYFCRWPVWWWIRPCRITHFPFLVVS
ncbi:MAG: hypothetical protein IPF56_10975 [Chloroflexi bacterium]|nr:hypothetical protein [Chloroflexota bacterium]